MINKLYAWFTPAPLAPWLQQAKVHTLARVHKMAESATAQRASINSLTSSMDSMAALMDYLTSSIDSMDQMADLSKLMSSMPDSLALIDLGYKAIELSFDGVSLSLYNNTQVETLDTVVIAGHMTVLSTLPAIAHTMAHTTDHARGHIAGRIIHGRITIGRTMALTIATPITKLTRTSLSYVHALLDTPSSIALASTSCAANFTSSLAQTQSSTCLTSTTNLSTYPHTTYIGNLQSTNSNNCKLNAPDKLNEADEIEKLNALSKLPGVIKGHMTSEHTLYALELFRHVLSGHMLSDHMMSGYMCDFGEFGDLSTLSAVDMSNYQGASKAGQVLKNTKSSTFLDAGMSCHTQQAASYMTSQMASWMTTLSLQEHSQSQYSQLMYRQLLLTHKPPLPYRDLHRASALSSATLSKDTCNMGIFLNQAADKTQWLTQPNQYHQSHKAKGMSIGMGIDMGATTKLELEIEVTAETKVMAGNKVTAETKSASAMKAQAESIAKNVSEAQVETKMQLETKAETKMQAENKPKAKTSLKAQTDTYCKACSEISLEDETKSAGVLKPEIKSHIAGWTYKRGMFGSLRLLACIGCSVMGASLLTGCSMAENEAAAESVISASADSVKDCTFLGDVDTIARATLPNARYELKLAASKLGATHVVETAAYAQPYNNLEWDLGIALSGRAYKCPVGQGPNMNDPNSFKQLPYDMPHPEVNRDDPLLLGPVRPTYIGKPKDL